MLSLQVYLKTANTSQEAPRFSFLNPELWSVVPCTHVEPEVTVTLFFFYTSIRYLDDTGSGYMAHIIVLTALPVDP